MLIGFAFKADGMVGFEHVACADEVVQPFNNIYKVKANKEEFPLLACMYALVSQVVVGEHLVATHENDATDVYCRECAERYDAVADEHGRMSGKLQLECLAQCDEGRVLVAQVYELFALAIYPDGLRTFHDGETHL